MREIKFRLIYNDKILGEEAIIEGKWHYQIYEHNPDNSVRWTPGALEVMSVERVQYTGLKDKNGKEIYEGDIVITEQPDKSLEEKGISDHWLREDFGEAIVFYDTVEGVYIQDEDSYLWSFQDEETVYHIKYLEIIGNIYENPELLDG